MYSWPMFATRDIKKITGKPQNSSIGENGPISTNLPLIPAETNSTSVCPLQTLYNDDMIVSPCSVPCGPTSPLTIATGVNAGSKWPKSAQNPQFQETGQNATSRGYVSLNPPSIEPVALTTLKRSLTTSENERALTTQIMLQMKTPLPRL